MLYLVIKATLSGIIIARRSVRFPPIPDTAKCPLKRVRGIEMLPENGQGLLG